jgi:tetratricopeptide (TPR) repeat protein
MRQQITSAQGKAEEYRMRGVQAQAAAFAGRFRDADALFAQAVAQARQQQLPKVAAQYQIEAALLQTVSGLKPLAQTNLTQALQLSPDNFTHAFVGELLPLGPLAFAFIGDLKQAQTFCEETAHRQPYGTLTNFVWLPTARATIELQRNNPSQAIELLQSAIPYDPGARFWPTWIRAQAYLQFKQGAQAAAEFQRIIDHRGWDVTSPLWPLAHLGLARAAMLQGDAAKAKQMYDEFFRLWKDADADLPVLMEAKKEYEKLK